MALSAPTASWSPDGDQLTFSAFIDKQTSVWAPGQVGLSEHLEVQFVAAGSQVRGSFQRTGEGPLRVQGKRREIEGDEIVEVEGGGRREETRFASSTSNIKLGWGRLPR